MCAADAFHMPWIGATPRCAGRGHAACGQVLKFAFHSADTPLNSTQARRQAEASGVLFPRPTSGLQFRFGNGAAAGAHATPVTSLAEAFA